MEVENGLKLILSLDSCVVVILHFYCLRGYLKITFLFSYFHILSHNLIYYIVSFIAGGQNKTAVESQGQVTSVLKNVSTLKINFRNIFNIIVLEYISFTEKSKKKDWISPFM